MTFIDFKGHPATVICGADNRIWIDGALLANAHLLQHEAWSTGFAYWQSLPEAPPPRPGVRRLDVYYTIAERHPLRGDVLAFSVVIEPLQAAKPSLKWLGHDFTAYMVTHSPDPQLQALQERWDQLWG